ncbi:hypothetical protein [Persicitalea sp.]|uniref:hypothetical protein n=1 Tax=Persicitalea sp. TaxID=3100273 RepID=UPI0035948EA0
MKTRKYGAKLSYQSNKPPARYCLCRCLTGKAAYERIDEPQRGHGRIGQRSYACHSLPSNALAARWCKVGMGPASPLPVLVIAWKVRR